MPHFKQGNVTVLGEKSHNTTQISLKLLLTINLRGCLCHLATEKKTALNLLLPV